MWTRMSATGHHLIMEEDMKVRSARQMSLVSKQVKHLSPQTIKGRTGEFTWQTHSQ